MSRSDSRLLLVEDDHRIRCELLEALHQEGLDTQVAVSLKDARSALDRPFGAVILDLGLPDGDGLDLVQELRAAGRGVPILILTARDAPEQRVAGLEAGADDYVVKPFHLPELLARVRNLLRRAGRSFGTGPVQHGDLVLDPEIRQATKGGQPLTFKPREFELLLFLVRHPGRTFTRDQLLDKVWGADYKGDARTVDLHVRRVRARIEDDPGDPQLIHTVWGVGYRMVEASAAT
ncbi:MAG: response regulator transcription factor [Planctomycetes bacterium]|nr:response regulator transcription factor [Planctomycetota bacterium]MDA0947267.1 response regulator transcription factor [Planctomycetota bacterium]